MFCNRSRFVLSHYKGKQLRRKNAAFFPAQKMQHFGGCANRVCPPDWCSTSVFIFPYKKRPRFLCAHSGVHKRVVNYVHIVVNVHIQCADRIIWFLNLFDTAISLRNKKREKALIPPWYRVDTSISVLIPTYKLVWYRYHLLCYIGWWWGGLL